MEGLPAHLLVECLRSEGQRCGSFMLQLRNLLVKENFIYFFLPLYTAEPPLARLM
jgi:hypothetical protein